MMSKDCDLLLDYFNDNLTAEEREKFELHLLECTECQEALEELQQLTEDLPYSSDPVEPPSGMKERVLSQIISETNDSPEPEDKQGEGKLIPTHDTDNEPKRNGKKGWYKPLIAAVLTASLIGNAVAVIYFSGEKEGPDQTVQPEPENSLDTIEKELALSPSEGVSAEATAMIINQNNDINLIVQASDLPVLKGEETYQVWVLEDGEPYRAGTFVTNIDGNGATSYVMNYEGTHDFDTIAITKEPNGESQEPKGDILLSSPI